jgi:uncharacterized membrane protein SirB2
MYLAIKTVHMVSAGVSLLLFCLRGGLVLAASAEAKRALSYWWLRVLPHVVDTVLLGSAVYLAISIRQAPLANDWLTAKVLALVLYIALGSFALKRARSQSMRAAAFVAALATFTYIVGVAMTKSVWSWLPLS